MLKAFRPALSLFFAILGSAGAVAQTPPAALSGRLTEIQGVPVLEVWGSPRAAGYAHGFLLAERIVQLFDEFVLDEQIGLTPAVYEGVLRPATLQQFAWSPAIEAELQGLLAGLQARLGAHCRSAKLDRPLELADLKAINTLADWRLLMCSSFAAWDTATATGEVLTARNLDYPSTPGMRRAQILLVHRGDDNGQPWIGVTWPGLVGVYTAMNAAGVTIAMHDARGLPLENPGGFMPRSLALRAALEGATGDYLAQAGAVLAAHRTAVGNNILVSGPRQTDGPPACVFEYDANGRSGGLTRRDPEPDANVLFCTNHMRARQAPRACERYEKMSRRVDNCAAAATPLTPELAHEIIAAVANDETLHTVLFRPERRSMTLWLPWQPDDPLPIDVQRWLSPVRNAAATQPARLPEQPPVTQPAATAGQHRSGRVKALAH